MGFLINGFPLFSLVFSIDVSSKPWPETFGEGPKHTHVPCATMRAKKKPVKNAMRDHARNHAHNTSGKHSRNPTETY